MPGEENANIQRWVDWAKALIGADWPARREALIAFDRELFEVQPTEAEAAQHLFRSTIPADRSAWYVHQCETYISAPQHCDLMQCSRILPVVVTLGEHLELLRGIDGWEERAQRAFNAAADEIDSTLFEFLVGIAYVRDGFSDVQFIPESPTGATPDLLARKHQHTLHIECKRKRSITDYAKQERARRLELCIPVRDALLALRRDWCVDIVLHRPMVDCPSDYLAQRVVPLLRFARPGLLIDDAELTATIIPADWGRLRAELRTSSIRHDTYRLVYLLFGVYEPWRGCTPLFEARPRADMPRYFDDVTWAAAVICSCDAPEAIAAYARHFRRELGAALNQLPVGGPAAIHIGAEAYDGEVVESRRYQRITDEMMANVNFRSRDVKCVYCNIFSFEVPPHANWDMGEQCHYFVRHGGEPWLLRSRMLLAEDDIHLG